MTLEEVIEERQGAKFLARQWVEFELYDCVTFAASVYTALRVIERPELPNYQIYSQGTSMLDLTCEMIEKTEGFNLVRDSAKHGDLVVLSRGLRGHHVGIYLKGRNIAHCIRGRRRRGVEIDSFVPPISDHIHCIYRPKIWDSKNQK